MSNRKFFPNNTITTAEDIKTLVNDFKSFHFVNNERAEALEEMTAIIDEFNEDLKNTAVSDIVNSGNILSAMIPALELDEKTRKTNARKRAVLNAVSYDQYKVDTAKNEIRVSSRPVTVRDIFAYKCNLLASAHADRKVTKEDREKAKKAILTAEQMNAFRLFIIGAFRFENVTDKTNGYNFNATDTEENALFLTATPSKNNAEKQIKYTATACGLGEINFKRIHALTLYKRAYTIDRGHQAKTADILDFTQDFIISARYAKNNIDLPEVNDRAEIFAHDTTAENENVIRF